MRLLYYNPSASGGLSDYAHEQASALAALGVEVTMLAPSSSVPPIGASYEFRPLLRPALDRDCGWYACLRRAEQVRRVVWNVGSVVRQARRGRYDAILIGAFFEYFAPLWAWRLRCLRKRGMPVGAVVHDPVRDTRLGPGWWHRWSIARSYACLSHAFVHQAGPLDTVRPQPRLQVVTIPHGPYRFPPARRTPAQVREAWGMPEGARVLLAFGHIRDGKNLDLVMRAMQDLPDHHLVVVGREQSASDRPAEWYAQLADTLGLLDRVRIFPGHVPAEAVGDLFAGADVVLATYSRLFRSASGVLNVAVNFRKPVLASSGPGSLKDMVERYELGVWVEPNDVGAIVAGLRHLAIEETKPQWVAYARDNSWEGNARKVLQALG